MGFICDNNLGKLVKLLRLAGFDTKENKNHNYQELLESSLQENRVLLTRDSKLINKIKKVKLQITYVKIDSQFVDEQLKQVQTSLKLEINPEKMFTICSICNTPVISVEKDALKGKIPPHAYSLQNQFWLCPVCSKYYWPGTHWEKIKNRLLML